MWNQGHVAMDFLLFFGVNKKTQVWHVRTNIQLEWAAHNEVPITKVAQREMKGHTAKVQSMQCGVGLQQLGKGLRSLVTNSVSCKAECTI